MKTEIDKMTDAVALARESFKQQSLALSKGVRRLLKVLETAPAGAVKLLEPKILESDKNNFSYPPGDKVSDWFNTYTLSSLLVSVGGLRISLPENKNGAVTEEETGKMLARLSSDEKELLRKTLEDKVIKEVASCREISKREISRLKRLSPQKLGITPLADNDAWGFKIGESEVRIKISWHNWGSDSCFEGFYSASWSGELRRPTNFSVPYTIKLPRDLVSKWMTAVGVDLPPDR